MSKECTQLKLQVTKKKKSFLSAPHMALIKLIFIAGSLFGMGTLPWQQNFIGLLAGISFGTLLTVALVPFVSITKYGRQKKVNISPFKLAAAMYI